MTSSHKMDELEGEEHTVTKYEWNKHKKKTRIITWVTQKSFVIMREGHTFTRIIEVTETGKERVSGRENSAKYISICLLSYVLTVKRSNVKREAHHSPFTSEWKNRVHSAYYMENCISVNFATVDVECLSVSRSLASCCPLNLLHCHKCICFQCKRVPHHDEVWDLSGHVTSYSSLTLSKHHLSLFGRLLATR